MNRRYLTVLGVLVSVVVFGSVLIGMKMIPLPALFCADGVYAVDHSILIKLRIPRALTAFLVGASLALCGMVFQAVFRNALATPYTLGVSSGASLGAVVAISCGLTGGVLGVPATVPCAMIGAMGVVGLVYFLSGVTSRMSGHTLLLSGVAVNLFCASLILFLQYAGNRQDTFHIVRWLMGSVSSADYVSTCCIGVCAVPAMVVAWRFRNELDIMLTGDDLAMARGVNLVRTRMVLYFVMSLLTGVVVAFCGPIGFLGMMVPHGCRRLFSYRHSALLWPVVLAGGGVLVVCDTVARVVLAPAELPVGVVMALLGGPFFLLVLLRSGGPE